MTECDPCGDGSIRGGVEVCETSACTVSDHVACIHNERCKVKTTRVHTQVGMRKKPSLIVLLALLLGSVFAAGVEVYPVQAAAPIYILVDGSIDPSTAPIGTFDNVTYTFTDDIYGEIVVERNNTVVDGAGFKVQGDGSGTGFTLHYALGLKQLETIEELLKRKREVYDLYLERLAPVMSGYGLALYEAPWFPDIYVEKRAKLMKVLASKGIGSRAFYPPLNIQFPYFAPFDYPNTKRLSQQGLWLPGNVTNEEVKFICDVIEGERPVKATVHADGSPCRLTDLKETTN